MKKLVAYAVFLFIFLGTSLAFLKLAMFVSDEFFSGSMFPLVMICGAGCYIGYLIGITFLKGAGVSIEPE